MNAVDAAGYTAQLLLLGIAIYIALNTVQRPTRSNVTVLVFFGLLVIVLGYSLVQSIFAFAPSPVSELLPAILVLTLPYVLLRLAWQYSSVSPRVMRLAEIGLLGSWALTVYPGPGNPFALTALVSYFAAASIYAARQFQAGSVHANGITRKRLRSLSIASAFLGIALFSNVFNLVLSGLVSDLVEITRQGMLVLAGFLYLVGFTPPALVRRSWQEPELRRFLRHTLELPRWSSNSDVSRHIERVIAETVGAPFAVIGMWNPETGTIDFPDHRFRPGETIAGKAFLQNRPVLSLDTLADDPEHRDLYIENDAYAVMAAPIVAEGSPTGVIALYSPNPPVFADDDLSLLGILADQIGVILANRRFVLAHAELAAREETARLKDEFLSVAAHDLKTPLTTILATGQHLERRLTSLPDDAPERRSISRLNRETRRLWSLVEGLLDASRIERGELLTNVETTDLNVLINDAVERSASYGTHPIQADVDETLVGTVDPIRIQQVIENLLENARKYSPRGSNVSLRARDLGEVIEISVKDQGTGIRGEDQERVFDRYFRSSDSNNGAEPGIGLGLYICKEIVDQHGGEIRVESSEGEGSTFYVRLPKGSTARAPAEEHVTANSGSG